MLILISLFTEHDIPEQVTLQVTCCGQVVAQTDFTYYSNSQHDSDLIFQYLVQQFPSYFPDLGRMDDSMSSGATSGAGGAGYPGYYGNVPYTSYNLLLGSCRLGIEQLVYATLDLPSMANINTEQVRTFLHTVFFYENG